jgi:uncharacterized protein
MKQSNRKSNAFILFKGESEEMQKARKVLSFLHVSIKKQKNLEEEKMSEKAQLQRETPQHGTFCWMDLATDNVEAAKKFYSELFGWNVRTSDVAGMQYNEFGVGEERIGGMWQMTEECKAAGGEAMPPHWMAYVAVDNVDDAASRVFDLGGKICVPPTDIPNVGRFCVINDPSGATLSLITLK